MKDPYPPQHQGLGNECHHWKFPGATCKHDYLKVVDVSEPEVKCPCRISGKHYPSDTNCRWCRCHRGVDVSSPFPCVRCGQFNCSLGQAHCEECEYGHLAKYCPMRVEVSTYSEIGRFIHGACREQPKKTELLIMDGDFYMELKNAINANGVKKMHLAIDVIAEEDGA